MEPPHASFEHGPPMPLDAFDAKLLNAVQADNRLSAESLADAVGLSPSACLRRLRRLRETGVIEADIAVVAPEAVGRQLMMVVEVTLERERPDLMDEFKRSMRRTPEVMLCLYVTGQTDFILIVTAKSMAHYEDFTRRFFFENANVQRFHTYVVMDRVKVGLAIPIETDQDR
jgi:Lrp/AsnC family leucine-responsive transcriptional regulator